MRPEREGDAMDSETVRQRIDELKDRDMVIRQRAVDALRQLGPEAKSAVPALTAALRDSSCGVRRRAAEALGAVGAEARSSVPALTEALRDRIHTVRDAARAALEKIGKA